MREERGEREEEEEESKDYTQFHLATIPDAGVNPKEKRTIIKIIMNNNN